AVDRRIVGGKHLDLPHAVALVLQAIPRVLGDLRRPVGDELLDAVAVLALPDEAGAGLSAIARHAASGAHATVAGQHAESTGLTVVDDRLRRNAAVTATRDARVPVVEDVAVVGLLHGDPLGVAHEALAVAGRSIGKLRAGMDHPFAAVVDAGALPAEGVGSRAVGRHVALHTNPRVVAVAAPFALGAGIGRHQHDLALVAAVVGADGPVVRGIVVVLDLGGLALDAPDAQAIASDLIGVGRIDAIQGAVLATSLDAKILGAGQGVVAVGGGGACARASRTERKGIALVEAEDLVA